MATSEIDELIAYRSIEQDPNDRLITTLCLGFAALVSAWCDGEVEPSDFDPPYGKAKRSEVEKTVSPNQQVALLGVQSSGNRSG